MLARALYIFNIFKDLQEDIFKRSTVIESIEDSQSARTFVRLTVGLKDSLMFH